MIVTDKMKEELVEKLGELYWRQPLAYNQISAKECNYVTNRIRGMLSALYALELNDEIVPRAVTYSKQLKLERGDDLEWYKKSKEQKES